MTRWLPHPTQAMGLHVDLVATSPAVSELLLELDRLNDQVQDSEDRMADVLEVVRRYAYGLHFAGSLREERGVRLVYARLQGHFAPTVTEP